jgi:hypothetical protein
VYLQIYVVRAECAAGKFVKLLWGKDKIQAALDRLDRLTNVEGLTVAAQIFGVVHDLADNLGMCHRAQQVSPLLTWGCRRSLTASNEINEMKRLLFFSHQTLPVMMVSCRRPTAKGCSNLAFPI